MRVGPGEFFSVLRRHSWSAIATFLLVCFLVMGFGVVATPRYDSYALLLVGESLGERRQGEVAEKQAEDNIASLALIAKTDDVLSDAAKTVGWKRLFPDQGRSFLDDLPDRLLQLRVRLGIVRSGQPAAPAGAPGAAVNAAPPQAGHGDAPAPPRMETTPALETTPAFLNALQRMVGVKPEPKASLIRITFGHSDPAISAEFANSLARSLITRQAELWTRPGAVDFFQLQRKRFEDDVQQASTELVAFVSATAAYSIPDQRQLLLKRASDVAGALATTRSSMAERTGQRQALADQLRRLKPVAASPFVSNLVDKLGGTDRSALEPEKKEERLASDPPILLVKVYQDAMAQLLKVNSDLAGLKLMTASHENELKLINEELSQLTEKEAQFDKLKKAVSVASSNAEIYSKRMTEEQINADLAKAKMAGLRLVQAAFVPAQPAFPNVMLLGLGGLIVGVMAAIAIALLKEWRLASRAAAAANARAATFAGVYPNETTYYASVAVRFPPLEEKRLNQITLDQQ